MTPIEWRGIRVTRKRDTIYVPLPPEARRRIAGGCQCPYCRAHPERIPQWDTLALSATPLERDFTFTVHYPEIAER